MQASRTRSFSVKDKSSIVAGEARAGSPRGAQGRTSTASLLQVGAGANNMKRRNTIAPNKGGFGGQLTSGGHRKSLSKDSKGSKESDRSRRKSVTFGEAAA